jgi:dUTP pyrophosphatase
MRRVRESDQDLEPPRYMSKGAAGMDLAAAVSVTLAPGARASVPIGFALEIPEGYEGQVRPRSGLSSKHGITVVNAPGTLDSDFRGEVLVLLVNHGTEPFVIERKMRIAQLVIAPVVQAQVELVESLSDTARGANGFGSSGN